MQLYTNTKPIDKMRAAEAIRKFYSYCNTESVLSPEKVSPVRDPEIIFVNGPGELEEKIDGEPFHAEVFNDVVHFINSRNDGAKQRMRAVLRDVFPYDGLMMPKEWLYHEEKFISEWEKLAKDVWDDSYLVLTFLDKCYVIDRPVKVLFNNRGFHCRDGASLVFRDGSEFYCYEGIKVGREHLLDPQSMTLKDIHQHNSRKHILIDMVGVDHYLQLVKYWKPPETRGRMMKFFDFPRMMLPGDEYVKKTWEKKGLAHHYEKDAYIVDIYHGSVNQKYGTCMKSRNNNNLYHFEHGRHFFDTEIGKNLFDEEDRELWDLFDVGEMFKRGASKLTLSYKNREFRLKTEKCRHDIAPSWFKARMFRGDGALYQKDKYVVKLEDGKLFYTGELPGKTHNYLFGGCENLPSYNFDINLLASSWSLLLEKWAKVAFNWLGMHEDSTRLP